MTVRSPSGPQHAAPSRITRRTLAIALISVGGLVILGCLGAIVAGLLSGPPRAQTVQALDPPATSASADGPTPAASASTDQSSAQPSPTPSPVTRPATTSASTQICQVTDNGGTFYLYVTSSSVHTFKACSGGTPYSGTIDQLQSSGSGMDRRCVLDGTTQAGVIVAVYSDTMHGNAKAAQAYCRANSGGDQG
jgi:hypothetical protein